MSLTNLWFFIINKFDWEKFAKVTHNQYRVVSSRPYVDSKGKLPDGYKITLQVIQDDYDYGIDKNGVQRENNVFQNFEVTVLNRKQPVKKGSIITLKDFDIENSYVFDYNIILRFKDFEVVKAI